MYTILLMIVSALAGFLLCNKLDGTKTWRYFASPLNSRLDLNWTVRQFFALFSKGMSERWYESRALLRRNVFISLLAACHLIHIVQIEYQTSRDNYTSYVIFYVHGFQSLADIKAQMPAWITKKKEEAKDAQYWYQSFVAGHNVIGDFFNGYFHQ